MPGFEIPSRFFRFLRSGDPRPLEPVLEHNRLDLVSLAAVTARAARLVSDGADGCPDDSQALALGRIYTRAGAADRAEACYRRATTSPAPVVRAHALVLTWVCAGGASRRFDDAARAWQAIIELTERPSGRDGRALRQFAVEALAIHHEHRDRDYDAARELALFALEEGVARAGAPTAFRHRVARLDRKIARKKTLSSSGAERSSGRRTGREGLRLGGGRLLLRLGGRLAAFGGLRAEPLGEPLDAAFRVDQLLPAREERVAVVANLEVQFRSSSSASSRSRRTRNGRRPRCTWGESLPSLQAPSGSGQKISIAGLCRQSRHTMNTVKLTGSSHFTDACHGSFDIHRPLPAVRSELVHQRWRKAFAVADADVLLDV